jgi:uncharacterized protein YkwD
VTLVLRARLALTVAVALVLLAPLALPAAAAGSCQREGGWAEMRDAWAAEVLALTNDHRTALGLSRLAPSESLTAAATWKAAHMGRFEYMAHDDPAPPIARSWDERIRDCGYSSGAGENIAYGYRTPQAVFQGWLDSAGHRRNIENASYKVIGVGAAVNADGTPYWAQIFGLRVETGDGLQVPSPSPSASPTPAPTPSPSSSPSAPPVQLDPLARDDAASVAEDGRASITPLSNDTGALAVVSVGDPAHGTATLTAGNAVVYVPDPDYNGTDSFSYVAADAAQTTLQGTVTVRVEPRNDAPGAARDEARARPRRAVEVPVLTNDSDVDGDELRVVGVVRAPYYGRAAVDAATGTIVYRARRGSAGRFDRLTYRVSDGQGGTAVAVVEVKIAR